MGKQEVDQFISSLTGSWYNPKMDKARAMLKKQGHNLMVYENDEEIYGVVKSQRSNAELLYAVKITKDGRFFCGTQNLRRCGGLRGTGPCKHIYLLGLAAVMDSSDVHKLTDWFRNASHGYSSNNSSEMKAIFEEYVGVLSGQVEWREIETLPEDYLAMT
ncbi:MAG: hypothetical protein ACFFD4_27940 [Candidatus Odinarchaeota archaeon]